LPTVLDRWFDSTFVLASTASTGRPAADATGGFESAESDESVKYERDKFWSSSVEFESVGSGEFTQSEFESDKPSESQSDKSESNKSKPNKSD